MRPDFEITFKDKQDITIMRQRPELFNAHVEAQWQQPITGAQMFLFVGLQIRKTGLTNEKHMTWVQ